jgi:hypothetical protein
MQYTIRSTLKIGHEFFQICYSNQYIELYSIFILSWEVRPATYPAHVLTPTHVLADPHRRLVRNSSHALCLQRSQVIELGGK